MRRKSSKNTGPMCSGSEILPPSETLSPSMLFAEVSPAKMCPWRVPASDSKEREPLFGPNSSDSFAKLGPDGSWLKTYQGFSQATVDGSWETFCGTWPQSGLMRNGECFRLPEWEPRTSDGECSLWPTPDTNNHRDGTKLRKDNNLAEGGRHGVSLHHAVMFPTPRASDGDKGTRSPEGFRRERERRLCGMDLPTAVRFATPQATDGRRNGCESEQMRDSPNLPAQVGGRLNPTWVEWLMGFPLGWTVLDASATPLSRKSRKRSGK